MGHTGETFVYWFSNAEKRVKCKRACQEHVTELQRWALKRKMQNTLENMTTEPTNKVPVKPLLRK